MNIHTNIVIAVLLFGLSLIPQTSHAHGQLPDVQAFCDKMFGMDKRKITRNFDKVDYYYVKRERQWYCRLTYPHLSAGKKSTSRPFDPAEVCGKTRGTYKVHHHQGTDVTTVQSMHCGITDGTLSADSGNPTTLKLCNRSSILNIYGTYAYWFSGKGRNPGWQSKGWYKLEQGSCRTFTIGKKYDSYLYVYAEGDGIVWGGQDARFCVDGESGFTINNADEVSCTTAPYRKVRMTKFDVNRGENTWNFR